jgi:hypothetical protein
METDAGIAEHPVLRRFFVQESVGLGKSKRKLGWARTGVGRQSRIPKSYAAFFAQVSFIYAPPLQ